MFTYIRLLLNLLTLHSNRISSYFNLSESLATLEHKDGPTEWYVWPVCQIEN